MSAQAALAIGSQPCVWMCAGLISYRLCSRGFDCENCPLDAALRGETPDHSRCVAVLPRADHEAAVPTDRWYSGGHTWLQPLSADTATWRFGIDAFGAAILASARRIRWMAGERMHPAGEPVCEIDLGIGVLALGLPIDARVERGNAALETDASCVVTDPYHDGWILELASDDTSQVDDLSTAASARDQMSLDLRRFRRTVAFHLLADVTTTRKPHGNGDEPLNDLRQVVGGTHYLELVREFVH